MTVCFSDLFKVYVDAMGGRGGGGGWLVVQRSRLNVKAPVWRPLPTLVQPLTIRTIVSLFIRGLVCLSLIFPNYKQEKLQCVVTQLMLQINIDAFFFVVCSQFFISFALTYIFRKFVMRMIYEFVCSMSNLFITFAISNLNLICFV